MKAESFSPHSAAPAIEATPFQLTYRELLDLVLDRRLAELEQTHPGEIARNKNIAGNMMRAVRAFMKANDLHPTDPIGAEMRDETSWEAARDRMGPKASSQKSLASKSRVWALEAYRAADARYDDENFGERLARLQEVSGLSQRQLAKSVSTGEHAISSMSIGSWLRGVSYPGAESRDVVEKLETVLGVAPGSLTAKMPKVPIHAKTSNLDIPPSIKRRVAAHLPDDFDSRSDDEQDEIVSWVSENILSTPKEIYDTGRIKPATQIDVFVFALAREPGKRGKMASARLLSELDDLGAYKTAEMSPLHIQRNLRWGSEAHEKADYDLRAFFGALDQMGLPTSAQSLSILLAPEAIERFIQWRFERRGAYTKTIENFLQLVRSLLHGETGFLTQQEGFGAPLQEIPGFVSKKSAEMASSDWRGACAECLEMLRKRIKDLSKVNKAGRDPFEALQPVIEGQPKPLSVYWKIIDEIRSRMPGPEYPVRLAEAQRSLIMMRVGLATGLRQRNLRELLVCPKGGKRRTRKQLERLGCGELHWQDGEWWIAIPGSALKNAGSKAVKPWNEFPLVDSDGLLDQELEAYLRLRPVLLHDHDDPGTLFIKTMRSRAVTPEFSQTGFYNAFRTIITTYGIYNPWTGRGAIEGLRPHGPHSMRHVIATHLVKTVGIDAAAGALFDTADTIDKHYGHYLPGEKHLDAMRMAFADIGRQNAGAQA